jgi:tetratricopeptide (TPR) repeat protein
MIAKFKLGVPTTDLPRVAQLAEVRSTREELDTFITKTFSDLEPDEHIRWLTSFPWRSIFTTNYDMGLERAYKLNPSPPQNPVPISVTANLQYTDSRLEVPIFHLHGTPYQPCPSPIVITQTDYARYQEHREMVWNRFKNDCATSTILYLGYSGRDHNWQLIIDEIASQFLPSKPPAAYRIDPFPDPIDVELHRKVRGIETLPLSLPELRAMVDRELGDFRPTTDTLNRLRNQVPQHLRAEYDKAPTPMIRLLKSWEYVTDAHVGLQSNTKDFLRGSSPNWSLIAQGHRFTRDIEDELWDWILELWTSLKPKSSAAVLLAPAGYGITTILMAIALRAVDAAHGPVFRLREGADVNEGDVLFAASLFPEVPCLFVVDRAKEHVTRIRNSLAQIRNAQTKCARSLFVMGERRNEWPLTAAAGLHAEEFDLLPLSDGEIDRLLDFLAAEGALGKLESLDRTFQFAVVKNKHEKQLLVAMREATEGEGVGFDAIIENEYRGIDEGRSPSVIRELYLLVCCFYQHGVLIRDRLLENVLGSPLQELFEEIGSSLEGVVDYVELDAARGEFGARARHRTIAEIVWKKCGPRDRKEALLQKAMERLNLTYYLDKTVFDLFIRSDEIVSTFSTFEGKVKFFETATQRDPNNAFVYQHFARMLLHEGELTLALAQIDSAIEKDRNKTIRSLHHTRGMVLAEMAITESNDELARKRLTQAEREFSLCIAVKEIDDYGHSGLANLYVKWSRRPRISHDEATEYLEKAESTISAGLKVVTDRASLFIASAEVKKDLGNAPARIQKLQQAVESNSASSVGRYLLARAYREQGKPEKTLQILDSIVKSDFKNVRAYLQYVRAMLDTGQAAEKCAATLSQCRLDGESDPAFVGLYGGLLYEARRYEEVKKLWELSKEQNFSLDERTRRRYVALDPGDRMKNARFKGTVQLVKPGYALIQPDEGPVVISKVTAFAGAPIKIGQKMSFELSFSAKGPLAEHLEPL